MSHGRSLPAAFTLLVSLALFAPSPVEAQPPACAVIPGLCSQVMSCDPLTSFPVCTATGCMCAIACNANRDCPNGQDCASGVCAPSPSACTNDTQCSAGQVCGAHGTCEAGPPPAPCTSDAACDDHNPCNGRETCDGRDCRAGVPERCDDGNNFTSDSCVPVDRAQNTFRCDHTGRSACSASPIKLPVIRYASGKPGSKGWRFNWSGTIETRVSTAPPHDVASADVRVLIADQKGRLLVDQTIKGGSGWKKDAQGNWTFTDSGPNAIIRRATFREPDAKQFGRAFEIEGALPTDPGVRGSRLAGGLIVGWTRDISGPCGVVGVPLCGPRQVGGETWTFCRDRPLR